MGNKMELSINSKEIFSLSTIGILFLFLLMLWSMQPWFAWNYTEIMIVAFSGCFLLLRFVLIYKKHTVTYSILIAISFAFLVYFMIRLRRTQSILGILNFIRTLLVFIFVMTMTKYEKEKTVNLATTIYAYIMATSIVAYLLVIVGFKLPYSIIEKPDSLFYPPFRNYRLFIIGTAQSVFFQRFQSIFTEPGHLATISALFLYINRYEIKRKSVLVIFISLLMSLSLAGYVLLILGYLIQMTARSKKIYITIFKITAVTALFFGIGVFYYIKYPDSMLSRLILRRFELDERKGIRGNNRTSKNFNYFYETKFLTSTGSIIWGADLSEAQRFSLLGRGGNNSYKVFLLNYGIISLILLFFMYFSIAAVNPSRLGFGLLLLYSASFLQRTQTPLWDMQLFLFIGAMQCFQTESSNTLSN